jgi:hypothetical protein
VCGPCPYNDLLLSSNLFSASVVLKPSLGAGVLAYPSYLSDAAAVAATGVSEDVAVCIGKGESNKLVSGLRCAGQLFLGPKLARGATIALNPLLGAGWAGLLANALNCIPVGTHATYISCMYSEVPDGRNQS